MAKKSKMPVESPVAVSTQPRRYADEEKREREYRARSALEDIERAEGHRKNKDLMRDVKSLAKEKVKCLSNIK